MDVDRKTVVQIVVSVAAVALFITGLVVVTGAYGETVTVGPDDEEGQLTGELSGEFDGTLETAENGTAVTGFSGEYENGIIGPVDGQAEGSVTEDGVFTGQFNGSISGAIDGTVTGTMNGTVEDGSFDGTFDGVAEGKTQTKLTSDGGLFIIGLIGSFIVALPLLGYLIERHDFEEKPE